MVKMGVRKRLMASYLILVAVTLFLLGGYILWYFDRHNTEILTANLLVQAQIIEEMVAGKMATPAERNSIDKLTKDLSAKVNVRITVIEPNGRVLADSWENPELMENHAGRPEIETGLGGHQGSAIRYSATLSQNMLYVSTPIYSGDNIVGVIRVSDTLTHVETGFYEIRTVLLAAFMITSLLALAISFGLARTYTKPLEQITAAAQEIAEGNLDRRVHVRTGDEIELLAHTLNQLASNLDDKVTEISSEKSKLELILQHTNSAIFLFDRYGQVVSANKAAIESFNITPAMLGQHNIQVIGNSLFDKALHDTVQTLEKRMIDLKTDIRGDKRAFQVFLAPIITSEAEISTVLAVFHDITALREMQERQAEFVANASHELATPLTAIKGFAETLLDGALKNEELSIKFVDIIHTEADRMHRLVKDLLQLAKLDSIDYRRGLATESTPVGPIVEAVIKEMTSSWQQKKLLVSSLGPLEPLSILVNPDWFKQVLINLLDNSVKYTQPGGKIEITWRQDGNFVAIEVKDTGVGISAQDLPRIFDRFYRVDRARVRTGAGGTGLGLAIVKFIVEMFNGKIEIESEAGVGTAITFSLPAAKQP